MTTKILQHQENLPSLTFNLHLFRINQMYSEVQKPETTCESPFSIILFFYLENVLI